MLRGCQLEFGIPNKVVKSVCSIKETPTFLRGSHQTNKPLRELIVYRVQLPQLVFNKTKILYNVLTNTSLFPYFIN